MSFIRDSYTLGTDRSAVLFRFVSRNFEVKTKAFAQEKISETE